jgi:hypothetical protein
MRRPSPQFEGGPAGASIGPRRKLRTSASSRSNPPLAMTTRPSKRSPPALAPTMAPASVLISSSTRR